MKLLAVSGLLVVSLLTACGQKESTDSTETSTPPRESTSIGLGVREGREAPEVRDDPERPEQPPVVKEEKDVDYETLFDWNGVWDTTYGEMRLTQAPPVTVEDGEAPPVKVSGTYDTDEGQIDASIYDGSLYGIWAETSSAQKCDTQKLGLDYWGGISYKKVDADTFEGVWTYCTEIGPGAKESASTSSWDGTRVSKVAQPKKEQEGKAPDQEKTISKKGFRGTWDTSEGQMTLEWADHVTISGTYDQDGGRIQGNVEGNLQELNGYWIENGSSQRCETEKQGSFHWGRVQFTLNEDDSEFDGQWSYCEADPDSSWTGKRLS